MKEEKRKRKKLKALKLRLKLLRVNLCSLNRAEYHTIKTISVYMHCLEKKKKKKKGT